MGGKKKDLGTQIEGFAHAAAEQLSRMNLVSAVPAPPDRWGVVVELDPTPLPSWDTLSVDEVREYAEYPEQVIGELEPPNTPRGILMVKLHECFVVAREHRITGDSLAEQLRIHMDNPPAHDECYQLIGAILTLDNVADR